MDLLCWSSCGWSLYTRRGGGRRACGLPMAQPLGTSPPVDPLLRNDVLLLGNAQCPLVLRTTFPGALLLVRLWSPLASRASSSRLALSQECLLYACGKRDLAGVWCA